MKNIKYFLIAVFAISLFSMQAFADKKKDVESVKKQIEKVETSFTENFIKGDAKAMALGYALNAIVFQPNVPQADGRVAIEKTFADYIALGKVGITLNTAEINVNGNIAVSHGTYTFELTTKDGTVSKDNGKYLEVWKEQKDGNWLKIYDMWNSNLPLAVINEKSASSSNNEMK